MPLAFVAVRSLHATLKQSDSLMNRCKRVFASTADYPTRWMLI
jgi:hypothetical protein